MASQVLGPDFEILPGETAFLAIQRYCDLCEEAACCFKEFLFAWGKDTGSDLSEIDFLLDFCYFRYTQGPQL